MSPEPDCPDRDRLKALLDDRLAPDEQAALAAHLEGCASCREALEGLAAASGMWGEVRVLADAIGRRDDTRETHETPPVDDTIPGFLDPPGPDATGTIGRFGPYDVLGVIGRGGWGIVLKGFDPSLHRPVAIKVLAPQYATSATARRRFVREARAAASISHDHVVTIHAVDECKGLPYLVMQYVAGKSLQERIDRTGPLEVKEVLRIGMQAARGLAAAHAQGLIHRDVKPANILLENGIERVKLTDFGLARAVDDASLTQSGLVAGTPQYMAPEQARGEAVDHRADLFSLGGVLYAMATGHSPFRGRSTMAVLRRVCDEAPRPVREVNPDISEDLAAVIHRLLAKDPNERFLSAAEVADVLSSQLARRQHAAPTVDVPEVGPEKAPSSAPKRRRSRAGEYAVIAAGMLMVLVVTNPFGVADQVKDFVQTVLRIKTADGTLVLNVDDPNIKVRVDDEDVVLTGAGPNEIRLRPGRHDLRAATDDGREAVVLVTIERGGKQVASIRHEPSGQPALVVGDRTATLLPKPVPTNERTTIAQPAPVRGGVGIGTPGMKTGPVAIAPPMPPATPDLATVPHFPRHGPPTGVQLDPLPRPELRTSIATKGRVNSLAWTTDGRLFAMVASKELLIVGPDGGRKAIEIKVPESRWASAGPGPSGFLMGVAPDGRHMTLGSTEAPAFLLLFPDPVNHSFLPQEIAHGYSGSITAIAYSPDSEYVAVGDATGRVTIRQPPEGRLVLDMKPSGPESTPITHLVFFKDGRGTNGMTVLLVADEVRGGRGFGLRLYNLEARQVGVSRTLDVTGGAPGPDFEFKADCLAVSPDGKTLVVGSKGKGLRSWDLTAGGTFRRIWGDTSPIALAYTPDGKALIVGNDRGEVAIDDAATGREGARFEAHRGRIRALAVAPDGDRFATAGGNVGILHDESIKLWALVSPPAPPLAALVGPAAPPAVAPAPAPGAIEAKADDPRRAAMIELARKNGGRMPGSGVDDPRRAAMIELARSLVDQAERRLAEAEAAREEARGDVETARHEVEAAEKAFQARSKESSRVKELFDQSATSAETLEQAMEGREQADAELRVARLRALLAESRLATSDAKVEQAKAEQEVANLNLEAVDRPEPGLAAQQRKARLTLAERDLDVANVDHQAVTRAEELARAKMQVETVIRDYREKAVARVMKLAEQHAIDQRTVEEEKGRLEAAVAAEKARESELKAAHSRHEVADRRKQLFEQRLRKLKEGEAQRAAPTRAEGSSRTR